MFDHLKCSRSKKVSALWNGNLDDDDDEDDDENEEEQKTESKPKTGLYRAPRKQMVHYDGEDRISREEKASAHERKRAIKR